MTRVRYAGDFDPTQIPGIRVTVAARADVVGYRQALGAKAGDKLLVVVRGPVVIILQKPAAHQPAIRGIGRGVYKAGYLHAERQSWD